MKSKNPVFVYLFLVVACVNCTQKTNGSSKTSVSEVNKGVIVFIKSNKSESGEIQVINRYGNTELLEFRENDTIRINSTEPINVIRVIKMSAICFRFYPNDTIQVTKEKNSNVPLYLSGDSLRDRELLYLAHHSYVSIRTPKDNIKRINAAIQEIDDTTISEINYLKKHANEVGMAKSFINEELENIKYRKTSKLISLLLLNPNVSQGDLSTYTTILNDGTFTYMLSFNQLCQYYLQAVNRIFKNDPNASFNWINSNINGKAKDVLLFQLIKSADVIKDRTIVNQLIVKYNKIAKDSDYKNYLSKNNVLSDVKFMDKNKDLLIDNTNQTKTIKSLFAGLRNKVIFIDLWASWCAPCRAEMPFSKKLKSELINHKEIAFLYISLDKDKAMWEFAEKELELNPKESYLFVNNFNAEFIKNLNVKTIPRYIIIDKSGGIRHSDAPRPSDKNLKNTLLQLLN